MNKWIGMGRLTRDPEVRYSQSGSAVANFSVAIDRRYKRDGKNNGLFNVSDGNRSYSEYFDIYDTQMFGEPTMNGFRVDRVVTAWMPLPDPYKAESEDETE